MCLDRLAANNKFGKKFHPPKEGNHFVGRKYFKVLGYGITFYYTQGKKQKLPEGVWLHEKDYRKKPEVSIVNRGHTCKGYPTGFHIPIERNQEREGNLIKFSYTNTVYRNVYYRKVAARGWDQGLRTVVAKEMFIVPE